MLLSQRSISTFLVLGVCLSSCGPNQASYSPGNPVLTKEEKQLKLTANDVFDGEKVHIYLLKDSIPSVEANKNFLKGLDLLKNKKNAEGAIGEFMASLIVYPSARTYYELGNAYMETADYHQALKAYEMAEKLDYEPFSKLLYNKACVYSQLEEYDLSADYLQYAVQSGYMNIDNIHVDPDLKKLREESGYQFKRKLELAMDGLSNVDNLYWLQFQKQFARTDLPASFKNDVSGSRLIPENSISYDFERFVPEMRDEMFSREVSKGFYYYKQIAEQAEFVALVYIIRDEFMGDEAPISYQLVTYSRSGKMIDRCLIAGRKSYRDELRMSHIDKDLTITIDLLETVFTHDLDKHGPYNNPIKSKNKVGEEVWKIDAKGKIIRQDVSLSANVE